MRIFDNTDELMHYGTPRHSGRYPWGSGENPYQNSKNFLAFVDDIKAKNPGISNKELWETLGMNSREYREARSRATTEVRRQNIVKTLKLKEKGWSNVKISEHLGISEATVRGYLKPGRLEKASKLENTANVLRSALDEHDYVDIGAGVEHHLNVSDVLLSTAVSKLVEEGYQVHDIYIPQVTIPGQNSPGLVLAKPGTKTTDIYKNFDKIHTIGAHMIDGGRSMLGLEPPQNVDSKRIQVVYGDEGGAESDGLIKLRPGVEDLNLGKSSYAQVRIAVDGTHYLKGVAVYDPDMPAGVDIQYYTPKSNTGDPHDVMKPMKTTDEGGVDQDNPFGASISRQHGALNVIYEEGDWAGWSKGLASQVLSKQPTQLAMAQLNKVVDKSRAELDEIKALTNPVVKKHLLTKFADGADADAVDLKAHAMPGQGTHVIIPVNSLKAGNDGKDGRPASIGEIYAPGYDDGEEVVLIRYPHGGIFEIPTLRVNNKNPEAKKLLGSSPTDAVAINSKTAAVLSGADFDGDTVLVIPNPRKGPMSIKTAPPLEELKGFDPRERYPGYEGMKVISEDYKNVQMGIATNLVTDMTIKGAPFSDIAKAVKHTMVVIDSHNHKLDWKQSEKDNNIKALKERYQEGGASTIISRSTAEKWIPEKKLRRASEGGSIDPQTGQLVYTPTNKLKWDGTLKTYKSTQGAETTDARTLMSSSPEPIERVYADFANKMKGLANEARLEWVNTKHKPYSPTARATYKEEVSSLMNKLAQAQRHAPIERRAQLIANVVVAAKKQDNPTMDKDTEKKIRNQAIAEQRSRYDKKVQVDITPREWEAIQAGAVTKHYLEGVLKYTDLQQIREYATPRQTGGFTPSMLARARAMLSKDGVTQAQVASTLGVSVSTLTKALREGVSE